MSEVNKKELIKILDMCAEYGGTPMHNAVWRALEKHKDDKQVKESFLRYEDSKETYRRVLI